jgi:hypothetical protein
VTESGEGHWHTDHGDGAIPMPLRAAAGLAAVAIDEARRLPDRLAGLPVLAVSTALQASLKAQQRYAELVARGDALLGHLRRAPAEAPPWAHFDDDVPDARPRSAYEAARYEDARYDPSADLDGDYGFGEPAGSDVDVVDDGADEVADADADAVIELAVESEVDGDDPLDGPVVMVAESLSESDVDDEPELAGPAPLAGYDTMTIPQLRARLRGLTERQLEELVAYERATGGRPPYLTMLENRLGTVRGG